MVSTWNPPLCSLLVQYWLCLLTILAGLWSVAVLLLDMDALLGLSFVGEQAGRLALGGWVHLARASHLAAGTTTPTNLLTVRPSRSLRLWAGGYSDSCSDSSLTPSSTPWASASSSGTAPPRSEYCGRPSAPFPTMLRIA